MNAIIEHQLINQLAQGFDRSPDQINGLHTSDAEILRCPGAAESYLALTTDSIAEEILTGLYADPELAGWMAVMANMSDLAAVGARPVGLLMSEIIPSDFTAGKIEALQRGIRDALTACDTFLLGGDTNAGPHLILTGCAAGWIDGRPVTRMGARPGDALFVSGPVGIGSAFAFSQLNGDRRSITYRPAARITEGQIVREHGTSCMDTSDGVLATLDQLMRLNGCGFAFEDRWEETLHPDACDLASRHHLSPWLMLAGEHGEFELAFTIPAEREGQFLQAAHRSGWEPLRLGRVTPEQHVSIPAQGVFLKPDTAFLRNLLSASHGNITRYIGSLLEYDAHLHERSH